MRILLVPIFLTLALAVGCAALSESEQLAASQRVSTMASAISTTVPESQSGDAAVNAARLRLTRDGLENPDLVSVVQITLATWPDDCLGLPSGATCQSTPTPGYAIELERGGKRYVVRTDQDGKQARIASSPTEHLADVFIQWQYYDGQKYLTAMIGTEQMQYGVLGEAMLEASSRASIWPDIRGQSQASYLRQRFAPFTANTISGTLVFSGTGTTVASKAEKRAVAQWAYDRFAQASHVYVSADYGLTLIWSEQPVLPCGNLWIYRNGLAVAFDCAGKKVQVEDFLSPAQLQRFYEWLDSGKRWYVVRDSKSEGTRPSLALYFPSQSSASDVQDSATADDIDQVLRFVREVYAELIQGAR